MAVVVLTMTAVNVTNFGRKKFIWNLFFSNGKVFQQQRIFCLDVRVLKAKIFSKQNIFDATTIKKFIYFLDIDFLIYHLYCYGLFFLKFLCCFCSCNSREETKS